MAAYVGFGVKTSKAINHLTIMTILLLAFKNKVLSNHLIIASIMASPGALTVYPETEKTSAVLEAIKNLPKEKVNRTTSNQDASYFGLCVVEITNP